MVEVTRRNVLGYLGATGVLAIAPLPSFAGEVSQDDNFQFIAKAMADAVNERAYELYDEGCRQSITFEVLSEVALLKKQGKIGHYMMTATSPQEFEQTRHLKLAVLYVAAEKDIMDNEHNYVVSFELLPDITQKAELTIFIV